MDGNKKVEGIKRHVLTCSLGFVLATLVTAANVHDTAAAGLLLDRAAAAGWAPDRVKVDGTYIGESKKQAAKPHGIEVQVTTRDRQVKGFKPLPLRWRIEGTFGTLTNRYHRLIPVVENVDTFSTGHAARAAARFRAGQRSKHLTAGITRNLE